MQCRFSLLRRSSRKDERDAILFGKNRPASRNRINIYRAGRWSADRSIMREWLRHCHDWTLTDGFRGSFVHKDATIFFSATGNFSFYRAPHSRCCARLGAIDVFLSTAPTWNLIRDAYNISIARVDVWILCFRYSWEYRLAWHVVCNYLSFARERYLYTNNIFLYLESVYYKVLFIYQYFIRMCYILTVSESYNLTGISTIYIR